MRHTVANISNILRYSTWESAQEQLRGLPIKWESYIINKVLKTHPPMEKAWLFFNWASQLGGFKHDQYTYTTMLDIFGEAGRISSMNFVFQQMQQKGIKIDSVTYTSLLHWLSNAGDVDGSMRMWMEMKDKRCFPTVVSYTAYMKVLFDHNRVKEATGVFKDMLECGCPPNCYTYTVLMDHLAGSGKYKEVLEIFNKMQETNVYPDKATCNILVDKCCNSGEIWAMVQILQYMKDNRLVLRYPVYLQALETLKIAGESDVLLRQVNPHFENQCINDETLKFVAITPDTRLVKYLFMKKNFVAVDHLIAEANKKSLQLDPSIVSDIIVLNCSHCRTDGALLGYEYSVKMGITVGKAQFLALINVFMKTNSFPKVVEIVSEMTKARLSLGIYHGALLIYRLGCARMPVFAVKVFELLPENEKCVATYTSLIVAYFLAGSVDKALEIFETMQGKGIVPALGTYSVLLAGLERSDRVREAKVLRKKKNSLQASFSYRDNVPTEEKVCNVLFARDGVL